MLVSESSVSMIPGTLYLSQLEKLLNNVTILKLLIIMVQIAKSIQTADTIDLNLCYCIFDSNMSFTTALFINVLMKIRSRLFAPESSHTVCVP